MVNNNIDKIFKDKVESLNRLPREVKWNKKIGWENYSKTFLNDKHILKKRTDKIRQISARHPAIICEVITTKPMKLS